MKHLQVFLDQLSDLVKVITMIVEFSEISNRPTRTIIRDRNFRVTVAQLSPPDNLTGE